MNKANKDELIKLGLYAAGAAITYFIVLKPLLVSLGLQKSDAAIKAGAEGTSNSAYLPNSNKNYTYTISKAQANDLQNTIYNAFNWFGINAYSYILNAFKKCVTKGDVNLMVAAFNSSHTIDFYQFLSTGGGIFPWDGLSVSELTNINNYVSKLPD